MGAVRRTAPIRNSFMQFSKLHLSTVVNFSLANLNESVGTVRRTAPIIIVKTDLLLGLFFKISIT